MAGLGQEIKEGAIKYGPIATYEAFHGVSPDPTEKIGGKYLDTITNSVHTALDFLGSGIDLARGNLSNTDSYWNTLKTSAELGFANFQNNVTDLDTFATTGFATGMAVLTAMTAQYITTKLIKR